MSRLPKPGGDNGTWGNILNDFLLHAHDSDGSLQNNYVNSSMVTQSVRDSLAKADNANAYTDAKTWDASAVVSGVFDPARIPPMSGQYVPINQLVRFIDDYPGANDAAKLQAAINAADTAGGGTVYWNRPLNIGTTTIVVPQGVGLSNTGHRACPVTYTGTGIAIDLQGAGGVGSSADTRKAGDVKVAVYLATTGSTGVRFHSTRSRFYDIQILGGAGANVVKGSIGVLFDANSTTGSSWNHGYIYAEYCTTGLVMDGSAFAGGGGWVTRNRVDGVMQACTNGVQMNQAQTNKLHIDVQGSSGTAWQLIGGCSYNLIITVLETIATSFDFDALSDQNTIFSVGQDSGTIVSLGAATNQFFATAWNRLTYNRSPFWYDGNGSSFSVQPKSGSLDAFQLYTRDSGGSLKRAWYVEGGSALAKPRFFIDNAQLVVNSIASLPTAGASYLGAIAHVASVSGVSDGAFYGCIRKSDNSYAWVAFAASGGPAPTVIAAIKPADTLLAQSSTTLTADPDLSIAVAASTTYEIEAFIVYDASTVADIQFGWTYPTGAVMDWTVDGIRIAGTTGTETTTRTKYNVNQAGSSGGAGVGVVETLTIHGTLVTSATAGTLTLTTAQNTSEATQVTVHARSRLRAMKIA